MWSRRWVIVDAAWRGWVESMITNEEKVRTAIAEQAAEWFVANDERPLDARDSAALAAWLKASPVHIEEFLCVSAIVRDLRAASTDPEYSLEAILARSRAADDTRVQPLWARVTGAVPARTAARWLGAAVTMAACIVLTVGLVLFRNARINGHPPASGGVTALHIETRHGEQLSRRLADNSVLHLNTDSAVTIRYGKTERLVTLTSGEVDFEVTHEPTRPFRVLAGSAEVVDIGTQFDVLRAARGHEFEPCTSSAIRGAGRRPADCRDQRRVAGRADGCRRARHRVLDASANHLRS
jgi:transmembrane sensor